MEITKERLSEIVYFVINNWSKNERYSKYKLEDYDNWKDDLIDTIWRELGGF